MTVTFSGSSSLEPLPSRNEPRLHGMSETEIAEHFSRYLAKVAWELADGERPIETSLTVEPHSINPCLEFPGFAATDPFHVSANIEVPEETDPVYCEMNIVPHTADEFPTLPYGFDEGDVEQAASIIRAFIVRRIVGGQRPSGL